MEQYTQFSNKKIHNRLAKILPKKHSWFPVELYVQWINNQLTDDDRWKIFEEVLDYMLDVYPDYCEGDYYSGKKIEDEHESDDYSFNADLIFLDRVLMEHPEKIEFILL